MTDRYENIRNALDMGPTPGPWSIRENETHVTVIGADNEALFHDDKRLPRVIADARLIAACDPDTIRDLLAERDQLAAENERLRDEAASALALLARMRAACGDDGRRMQDELEAYLRELRADAERLDYIERTYSGVTNRERYLPVQMIWGKGCNGRTLREACDKYMARTALMKENSND